MATEPEVTTDNANLPVRHRVDTRPAEPAIDRYSAEVDNPFGDGGPFQLARLRRVIDAFVAAGVPDDAYVQPQQPVAWASWERPHHG